MFPVFPGKFIASFLQIKFPLKYNVFLKVMKTNLQLHNVKKSDGSNFPFVFLFLTWKKYLYFFPSCSGDTISLHHSFTPSLLGAPKHPFFQVQWLTATLISFGIILRQHTPTHMQHCMVVDLHFNLSDLI